jgi:hypothetical protein
MVQRIFHEADGILYVNMEGTISLIDMFDGVDFLVKERNLPRELKILESAEKVKVTFDENDISLIVDNFEKSMGSYESIRHAVIHSDPTNTAYTIIASNMIKNCNYHLMVFSTIEAAKLWLNKNN